MTEQLKEIGFRLRALRTLSGFSEATFASKLGITAAMLKGYEDGLTDFSFSFLFNAATVLDIDIMDILTGDSPRLTSWCIVRNGQGFSVDRDTNYGYRHLAATFKNKIAEPFLVTIKNEPPVTHNHEGQEFNYFLKGKVKFTINGKEYDFNPGDSIYFNSALPHSLENIGDDAAEFIAVVLKEGGHK